MLRQDHGVADLDLAALESKVLAMYRLVADEPEGHYHFELGRSLAERLGYPADLLDQVPAAAVESYAGVGHFFDLAALRHGEAVLDLGSGSGMDSFLAAVLVGSRGRVVGVDMTPEQTAKADRSQREGHFDQVSFTRGHIEDLPFPDASFDVVISNGVINLVANKARVFEEAARVLRPLGRLVVADITTEVGLAPRIVANADLWAACIGGASQQERYEAAIETSGLRLEVMKRNPYAFLSEQAREASERYGVRSISLLARKPRIAQPEQESTREAVAGSC